MYDINHDYCSLSGAGLEECGTETVADNNSKSM